jgi:hypothetical protein
MKNLRHLLFLGLLLLPLVISAQGAAPMPYGHWATSPPSEELYVNPNGSCAFLFQGEVRFQGTCTWNPSSRGGILTLSYPMPLEPGKIYYNVIWVNSRTITVFGDVFHLQ